jgi:hypothetical protein
VRVAEPAPWAIIVICFMVYSYAFQIVSLRDQIRRELYGQGHFG